ncbi:MAG: hypothetical protein OXI29_08425 [bacterium]|nr:hypothetical protein [bacterium]
MASITDDKRSFAIAARRPLRRGQHVASITDDKRSFAIAARRPLRRGQHVASIIDDKRSFAGALAPALGLDTDQALESPHSMIGTVDEVVDKLVRQREELGISYIGLSIESMEDMAPVVARLAGT